MAASFQTTDATLLIPGSYVSWVAQTTNSGLATSGVVALIGEADQGPDFTLETDLDQSAFGPDQESDMLAKYRSGPLVDAYYAAVNPANDPNIIGAPSRVVMIKTNPSLKATLGVAKWDTSSYGFLADKSYGKKGNLINTQVLAKTSEVVPTTGSFTYIPAAGTVAYNVRVNGGAALTGGTLSANTTPAAFKTALDALTGLDASGGVDRVAAPASGNIALTVLSGNAVQIDTTVALAVVPSIGDTFIVPDASVIEGPGGLNANVGAYVVTGASASQILCTKLADAGKPGAVPGTITAPTSVSATALSGTPANDMKVFTPITLFLAAANPLDGLGKSLEISQLATGTDLLARTMYQLGTITPVTFISKTGAAKLITSTTEYSINLVNSRQVDQVSETLSAGGEIAMKIGYLGTTASLTIDDVSLTTTVSGGSGANLSLSLKDYPTIADLATYINAQVGYTAAVGSGTLGLLPCTALDDVTAGICSTFGEMNGRLKIDAYRLFNKISGSSVLVQLQNAAGIVVQATGGLPAPMATVQYLAGGAKGATLAATVAAAFTALEKLSVNFVVPCFSRDATADIIDGLTDSSSTYVIDDINLLARTHVNAMATLKRRRNRQAIVSKRDTFTNCRQAAANLASFRINMVFQDARTLGPDGTVTQKQPYVLAATAAGMQAAGFYRNLTAKAANVAGALSAFSDFDDRDDTNVEDALLAGLMVLRREATGGWSWVSDQTTYGADSNFLYNSLANVYIADTIALTSAQRFQKAFIGQSIADVPASLMKSFMEAMATDFLRLKLIAPSDDAPKGVKNIKVVISGNAARVNASWKLAGAILFIDLSFLYEQVTQTAG